MGEGIAQRLSQFTSYSSSCESIEMGEWNCNISQSGVVTCEEEDGEGGV